MPQRMRPGARSGRLHRRTAQKFHVRGRGVQRRAEPGLICRQADRKDDRRTASRTDSRRRIHHRRRDRDRRRRRTAAQMDRRSAGRHDQFRARFLAVLRQHRADGRRRADGGRDLRSDPGRTVLRLARIVRLSERAAHPGFGDRQTRKRADRHRILLRGAEQDRRVRGQPRPFSEHH